MTREPRVVYCKGCLEKQRIIDQLREENRRLKAQLRHEQRKATEGPFGSSTPSSQIPVKPNTPSDEQQKRGGAKPGHEGHGRQAVGVEEADRVEVIEGEEKCPCCGGLLEDKGVRTRTVVDGQPLKKETIVYHLGRKWCARCRRSFQARAPGVLPKSLYGNQLLTHVVMQHYAYDVPLGRLEEQLGIGYGSLLGPLHRLAGLLKPVIDRLVEEYPRRRRGETRRRDIVAHGWSQRICVVVLYPMHKRFPFSSNPFRVGGQRGLR